MQIVSAHFADTGTGTVYRFYPLGDGDSPASLPEDEYPPMVRQLPETVMLDVANIAAVNVETLWHRKSFEGEPWPIPDICGYTVVASLKQGAPVVVAVRPVPMKLERSPFSPPVYKPKRYGPKQIPTPKAVQELADARRLIAEDLDQVEAVVWNNAPHLVTGPEQR